MKTISIFANANTLTLLLFIALLVLVTVLASIGFISFLCDNYSIHISVTEDYLSSLRVLQTDFYKGVQIDIVVLPQGTAIEKLGTSGGGLAQPYWYKGGIARIILHDEALCLLTQNDLHELLEHEMGHLISLTNDFMQEFDSTKSDLEIVDPREVENLIAWCDDKEQADFWEKVSPVVKRDDVLDFLQLVRKNQGIEWLPKYCNLRELAANYHMVREWRSLSLLNILSETAGYIGLLVTKNILSDFDFDESEEEEIKSRIEKEYAPLHEVYKSFL